MSSSKTFVLFCISLLFSTACFANGVITSGDWGVAWISGSTYKIRRDAPVPSNKISSVKIFAARNEYEPFQIILRPAKQLDGVKVAPRSLSGPSGAKAGCLE